MYTADYDDYSGNGEAHEITVWTDDGNIFSAKFEGGGYQSDPAWISAGSDGWYERLTELAEGEAVGAVPEELQKLIRSNYGNFSEWTAAEMTECGTLAARTCMLCPRTAAKRA